MADSRIRHGAGCVLLALAYALLARANYGFVLPQTFEMILWLPKGLALAALLIWGVELWPGILLGGILTALFTARTPFLGVLVITAGNTLEVVVAALLLERAGFQGRMTRLRDLLLLALYGGALSTLIGAVVGTGVLVASGLVPAPQFWVVAFRWWAGDGISAVLVTPCCLIFWHGLPRMESGRRLEASLVLGLLTWASMALFSRPGAHPTTLPLLFLVFPLFIWSGLRFGPFGAVFSILAAGGLAIWGTLHGQGPFGATDTLSPRASMWLLRAFLIATGFTSLMGAALLREREDALRALRAKDRELEQRNRDLAHLNEQKGDLINLVIHDLRNPIGGVLLSSELVGTEAEDPELVRREAQRIRTFAQSMDRLITRFLDLRAIEAGRLNPNSEPLDLGLLLQEACGDLEPRARAKEQEFRVGPNPWPVVQGDLRYAREVIDNLLSNAIKYSPLGAPIRVWSARNAGLAGLAVEDEGPGLDPEEQGRLFTAFAKLSPQPTGGEPSTGLGLSLVKRLMEAQDGRILVVSHPGRGSVFTALWPRASGLPVGTKFPDP